MKSNLVFTVLATVLVFSLASLNLWAKPLVVDGVGYSEPSAIAAAVKHAVDQAVADMGPPDKQAKLSDGKTVAEWITRRSGGGMSIGIGGGSFGRHSGVGVGVSQPVGTGSNVHGLRLIFDTDGKLISWSK